MKLIKNFLITFFIRFFIKALEIESFLERKKEFRIKDDIKMVNEIDKVKRKNQKIENSLKKKHLKYVNDYEIYNKTISNYRGIDSKIKLDEYKILLNSDIKGMINYKTENLTNNYLNNINYRLKELSNNDLVIFPNDPKDNHNFSNYFNQNLEIVNMIENKTLNNFNKDKTNEINKTERIIYFNISKKNLSAINLTSINKNGTIKEKNNNYSVLLDINKENEIIDNNSFNYFQEISKDNKDLFKDNVNNDLEEKFEKEINSVETDKLFYQGWIKYLRYEDSPSISNKPKNFLENPYYFKEKEMIKISEIKMYKNNQQNYEIDVNKDQVIFLYN